MPPTIDHTLPLHFSAPKHVAVPPFARRHRKLIFFTSILFFLTLLALSSYTRPIYSRKFPFSTSHPPAISHNSSEYYSFEPPSPLSSLGTEADRAYKFGSFSPVDYRASLEGFIEEAFPSRLRSRLKEQLHQYLDSDESPTTLPERPNIIWQTYDVYPESPEVRSWQSENPNYDYRFLYDDDVEAWVKRNFKGSLIEKMWNTLPHIILVKGGIYSDIDTLCLKPIDVWGTGPDIRSQMKGGDVPAVILGVEADVMTMELQRASIEPIEKMSEEHMFPLVLEWTGPGVFTDGALRFLQIQNGLQWIDLRQLEKPLRIGEITILPVTGFSPQVGNFGSKSIDDPQAMVS
ncbi:hypothetical protein Clacol_003821 [Clathrus columnatus]|uniref:Uncharacterized protein n=1 Tax=Clathrus columnatus TaxID=1419009 RepID=A0AAV5AAD4_9AGAM|nr:hypothetical protein Clacol_003821 [Clathrus columnatus]